MPRGKLKHHQSKHLLHANENEVTFETEECITLEEVEDAYIELSDEYKKLRDINLLKENASCFLLVTMTIERKISFL